MGRLRNVNLKPALSLLLLLLCTSVMLGASVLRSSLLVWPVMFLFGVLVTSVYMEKGAMVTDKMEKWLPGT